MDAKNYGKVKTRTQQYPDYITVERPIEVLQLLSNYDTANSRRVISTPSHPVSPKIRSCEAQLPHSISATDCTYDRGPPGLVDMKTQRVYFLFSVLRSRRLVKV